MNYASTNEANNHDNDFPVMTGDDVADMVCKAASAPASVDRLEDLAPELRKVVLELYSNPKTASMTISQYLQLSGIVETTGGDEWTVIFTERGAALVRDYQRRQAESVVSVPEWQAHGFATEDEYLFMQSLGARDQEVVALEAENARLQGDLAAAREAFVKIQYLTESLTDGSDSVLSEIVEISRKAWQSIK